MGRIYRSMQGKEVDMDKLMAKHETMPAIGNAGVNARGDEIGPGGKVIRTKEQVMSEYYEKNPKVKKVVAKSDDINVESMSTENRGKNESKRKN